MDCSPPGSSVHGVFQARLLKWVSISFSRGSSRPRDQTHVSCIGRRILYHWATRKAQVWTFSQFSSVTSCVQLATPWTAALQASLSITNRWRLLKLLSITLVMPSNHLIFCRPLLLLPSVFPRIRVFSSESVLHIRWPKDWSFSFSISPSSEYSGPISFRMDWYELLKLYKTYMRKITKHSWKTKYILKQMERAPSSYWILEKEMATHSSTLAWKMQWTEDPGRLQSMGSQRIRYNWATSLHFTYYWI